MSLIATLSELFKNDMEHGFPYADQLLPGIKEKYIFGAWKNL